MEAQSIAYTIPSSPHSTKSGAQYPPNATFRNNLTLPLSSRLALPWKRPPQLVFGSMLGEPETNSLFTASASTTTSHSTTTPPPSAHLQHRYASSRFFQRPNTPIPSAANSLPRRSLEHLATERCRTFGAMAPRLIHFLLLSTQQQQEQQQQQHPTITEKRGPGQGQIQQKRDTKLLKTDNTTNKSQ